MDPRGFEPGCQGAELPVVKLDGDVPHRQALGLQLPDLVSHQLHHVVLLRNGRPGLTLHRHEPPVSQRNVVLLGPIEPLLLLGLPRGTYWELTLPR